MRTPRFLVTCCCSLFVSSGFTQTLPFDLASVYDTNNWDVACYPHIVGEGLSISISEGGYTNISHASSTVPLSMETDVRIKDVASGAVFRLRLERGHSVAQSISSMLGSFSLCSAAQPFPLFENAGRPIGDRAYRDWGQDGVRSLSIVRNNVFFDVVAETPASSVVALARYIDDQILFFSTNVVAIP